MLLFILYLSLVYISFCNTRECMHDPIRHPIALFVFLTYCSVVPGYRHGMQADNGDMDKLGYSPIGEVVGASVSCKKQADVLRRPN